MLVVVARWFGGGLGGLARGEVSTGTSGREKGTGRGSGKVFGGGGVFCQMGLLESRSICMAPTCGSSPKK